MCCKSLAVNWRIGTKSNLKLLKKKLQKKIEKEDEILYSPLLDTESRELLLRKNAIEIHALLEELGEDAEPTLKEIIKK